jgi:uncharacterized membrane protein YfcA
MTFASTLVLPPPLASVLTEPLEVVGVISAFSFCFAGFAGAAEYLRGKSGHDIADAAATGAAAGFIVGLFAGAGAALYLVMR